MPGGGSAVDPTAGAKPEPAVAGTAARLPPGTNSDLDNHPTAR
jgi:hypothetical protein